MSQKVRNIALLIALAAGSAAACDAGSTSQPPGENKPGPGEDGDIELPGGDADDDIDVDPNQSLPPTANCADSILDDDEVCDDGNSDDGDGCYGNCRGIERGFICPKAGEPCLPFAVCGDGLTAFPEQCDDGGIEGGDGCSKNCKLELGFKCTTSGVSVCSATTCGDGVVEGAEMCEPSEDLPNCTSQCQFAPDCSGDGACTSDCGDGLVLGEDCDDGNLLNGDGCDSSCKVEPGYMCTAEEGDCTRNDAGECILKVPVTYRDFGTAHYAFQNPACDTKGLSLGQVGSKLVNGLPDPTSNDPCWQVPDWYTDSGDNTTFHSELTLYENGSGGFVNRWGPNGEQWPVETNYAWAAATVAECAADGCVPCPWAAVQGCTADLVLRDGTPFFFPVDGIEGARADGGTIAQVIEGEYLDPGFPGAGMGVAEHVLIGGSPVPHNFHFTSEVAFWFPYDADTDATLVFTGDDDVWVFINGNLAVDLGGMHSPETGSVTVNATTAPGLGLTAGNVYEIKVFHAERMTTGSTFRLTLSGFNTRRSECTAECGDGIVGFGEQCDDGVNDGGYNECQDGCVLGPYCGDGKKDENETCDDNDPEAPAGCSGCRLVVVR